MNFLKDLIGMILKIFKKIIKNDTIKEYVKK